MDKELEKIISDGAYTPWHKLIKYKVELVDSMPHIKHKGILGITNHRKKLILISKKDENDDIIDKKQIESILYHEIKHADFLPIEIGIGTIIQQIGYWSILKHLDNPYIKNATAGIVSVILGFGVAWIVSEIYAYGSQLKRIYKQE